MTRLFVHKGRPCQEYKKRTLNGELVHDKVVRP